MRWRVERQGNEELHRAVARDASASEMISSTREAWARLTSKVLPLHKPKEWNVIRLYFAAETGRSLLYPDKRPFVKRVDRGQVDVRWPRLKRVWTKLESSGTDEGIDEAISAAIAPILTAFQTTFYSTELSERVEVVCYAYEEYLQMFKPRSKGLRSASSRGSKAK
jgi:hypothetical protein